LTDSQEEEDLTRYKVNIPTARFFKKIFRKLNFTIKVLGFHFSVLKRNPLDPNNFAGELIVPKLDMKKISLQLVYNFMGYFSEAVCSSCTSER
jgi:hypothetical protein